MRKRVVCLLLAVVMAFAMGVPAAAARSGAGLSNFKKVNTYTAGQFPDVSSRQWYAANVQVAYELDLMKGGTNGKFNPTANISVIETIVTACRLHSIYYTGKSEFVNGSPWYQPYVDYAGRNGIIKAGEYSSYNAPATRAQFVSILAGAFPQEALPAINDIGKGAIPDVSAGVPYSDTVYLMYNAGILVGNDDYGTFDPTGNINRVQAAAIITRMADASLRLTKTLKVKDNNPPTGVTIRDKQVSWSTVKTELAIGQSTRLVVELRPADAASGITWSSSDPTIASVSEYGTVTAHKQGSVTITAKTYNGVKDTFKISVPNGPAQLQYELTADGKGYEITGCDTGAYTAHIPATYKDLPVVSIRAGAFKDCQDLRCFTVAQDQTVFYEEGGVVFTNVPEKTLVVFPPAYDEASYYYVPQGTIAIAPYAFAGFNSLLTLTLPEGVKRLGDCAFAEARKQTFIYVPDSLTDVGADLMNQQYNNAIFCGSAGTAVEKYADQAQIPYSTIREGTPDSTTAAFEAPEAVWDGLVPAAGDAVVVPAQEHRHFSWYEDGDLDYFCDLTSYQEDFSGEVRLALDSQWTEVRPDPNGDTMVDAPVQTGLYGAGYNEGEAILRAYDREGNLLGMQDISGDFAFCFPGAASLGVEGGSGTKLTVLPVEPVYVQTGGVISMETDGWYELADGTARQYFILRFPHASVSFECPNYLNLYRYYFSDCTENRDQSKNEHYLIMSVWIADASRNDQMNVCSIVLDGMDLLMDNEELRVIANSGYGLTADFAEKAYHYLAQVKQTMAGSYYPPEHGVHKITIKADGSYPNADWEGMIYLNEHAVSDDPLTLIHEMVHAVDGSIPAVGKVPPGAWVEGRAEYISAIVYEKAGYDYQRYDRSYDWSFLSEEEKADFFRYYYFSANRYTQYDVGYYFLCYLSETYGEDISSKIMANIAALTEYDYRQRSEANAVLFKQCVEDATEVDVFQNFVRDVIEK